MTRRITIVGLCLATVLALGSATAASAWGASVDGFSWGRSFLGNGTGLGSDIPTQISGLSEVAALAGGESHALGLLGEGAVVAFGDNGHGQLGDGNFATSSVPVAVTGLGGATAIAAGGNHSLALLAGGSVEAWGSGEHGELGNGATEKSDVPVGVSDIDSASAIAAGSLYSLALLSGGTVEAWGSGEHGELGDGTTAASNVPVAVSGLSGVAAIAASGTHSLALLGDGTVMAWGDNEEGQLGDGGTADSDVPVAVTGLSGVVAIAAGAHSSYALLSDGSVMAWGEDKWGQLGDGELEQSDVPVAVDGLSGVSAVAAGGDHALALLGDGTVMAWGGDEYGELGNGSEGLRSDVPVAVACNLQGITGVAAGYWTGYVWGAANELCPVVSGVSPGEGPAGAETPVSITGSGFSGATAVKFGAAEAVSFSVESATEIEAVAPPGKATVNVTVTTAQGTSQLGSRDQFTYSAPPTVTRLSTDRGGATGDTYVAISGTNLGNVTAVRFGATDAKSFNVIGSSEIQAYSPAGSGTVDVTVTNPSGTSEATAADRFTYLQAPEFGRCVKEGVDGGEYHTSTCETYSEVKTPYEWFPAFGGREPLERPRLTTLSSRELKLETTGKVTISCAAENGGGEYAGDKSIALGVLTLSGCREGVAGSCASAGAAAGEVRTDALIGQLGAAPKGKYGLQIEPAGGETLAEFSCGEVPVTLEGSAIAELKAGKMLATQTLKASEKKGVQKPTGFTGGPEATLRLKIGSGAYEQAGLAAQISETGEEAVEVNPAV